MKLQKKILLNINIQINQLQNFKKNTKKENKKKLNKKKNWWKKKIKIRYPKNDILFTIFILKENNYNLIFSDFKFI